MQSVEITYLPEEGKANAKALTVKVLPIRRNKYNEVLELCHLLLVDFSNLNAYPGDLLNPNNENVWGNIVKLCQLMPLVGGGVLDPDRLSNEDILRVFFTRTLTRDEDGRLAPEGDEAYASGEIAKLNGFSFFRKDRQGLLQRAISQSTVE